MPFSRARYVTLCQQTLVTAAVLAVGVSAAGVKTLDIVPQPGPIAGVRDVPDASRDPLQHNALADHVAPPAKTRVDVAPVTPKVREVRVTGVSEEATAPSGQPEAGRRVTPRVSAEATPKPTPSTVPEPKATPSSVPKPAPQPTKAPTLRTTKRLVALSAPEAVHGYATVGVTWRHGAAYAENQIAVQLRTMRDGVWSAWQTAGYHDDHGPDGGSAEGDARTERPGTDAVVVGDVDQVQMRAETSDGTTPPDLKLAVIDPGAGTMKSEAAAIDTATLTPPSSSTTARGTAGSTPEAAGAVGTLDSATLSAMKVAPRPTIYSRAQWGANEGLRDQSAPSYGTVRTGFIHHTVNANNYTADQVPALLRGIYAYHTQSRGWRDIGYNYLVDRFGRIWEGRYGGITKAVVGAHTLGYNEVSFAMSAIGNYDIVAPPQAVLVAYAKLFAWKLSLYNIRADATHLWVKDRYLNAINGHRDVGQTACPGRYLYAKIPYIRALAQSYQNAAQSGTTVVPPPAAPDPNVFTSPTQAPKAAAAQPAISFPRSLNLAGDSNPDLVLKARNGVVQVFQTGGQTGFLRATSTPGGWFNMDRLVAVGDVTGDGRGDVLGRLRTSKVSRIYRGNGLGRVTLAGVGATSQFRYADMITAAGDWNRDGRNDVLMRDARTGYLWMVPGRGNGTFKKPRLLSRSWRSFTSTAVAGDLTGDGRPDIVALHRNGFLYAAASNAKGGLSKFSRRLFVGKRYNLIAGAGRDMTGDGYGDVVLRATTSGQAIILPGRPGTFGAPLGPFDQSRGLRLLSAGQMSGAAQPDLVGTNARGTALLVVANNGRVNLRGPLASNLTRADASQILNVGDWNRDGRVDVVTRQSGADALVLRPGLGNGQFGAGIVMSYGWRSFTNLAALGDVTGDGLPDLVGKTAGGPVTIFPGNGAHGFTRPVLAAASMRTFNQIGNGSWNTQQLPNSAFVGADGSFVPYVGNGAGDPALYDWVLGPGDVDGDGRSDLVARDPRGTLWLLPGTGTGLGPRRVLATGFSGYSLGG